METSAPPSPSLDEALWQQVQEFNFDDPLDEYPFSVRLAYKQKWTKNFTQKAILEYKKFMYLTATAGGIVFPSSIVDEVWHNHLTYPESYARFCKLLGKDIQHIPSVQEPNEKANFKSTESLTQTAYREAFGNPPSDIWDYPTMAASLELKRSRFTKRQIIKWALIGFAVLFFPLQFLLAPMFNRIGLNYNFGLYFAGFFIVLLWTETLATPYFKRLFKRLPNDKFLNQLHPLELIYFKSGSLSWVFDSLISRMVEDGKIKINQDKKSIVLNPKSSGYRSIEEYAIAKYLGSGGNVNYKEFIKKNSVKHLFQNLTHLELHITEHITESVFFLRFYSIRLFLMLAGIFWASGGIIHGNDPEAPILFLSAFIVIMVSLDVTQLSNLQKKFNNSMVEYYEQEAEPNITEEDKVYWQLFLFG